MSNEKNTQDARGQYLTDFVPIQMSGSIHYLIYILFICQNRTGGLVIWRSGSSVVLYRGTGYKMQCVQSFSKQNERTIQPIISDSAKYLKDLSKEELTDFSELNQLLDELGPRFRDWCGREPYPIDADLLPAIDPEYKPPFRLFPYGVRHSLTNKEMTMFRRVARTMAPHFALGMFKCHAFIHSYLDAWF